MKRLRGWTRIGIVISILWSLIVFGFAAIEYFEISKEREVILSQSTAPMVPDMHPEAREIFFEWQRLDAFDLLAAKSVRVTWMATHT